MGFQTMGIHEWKRTYLPFDELRSVRFFAEAGAVTGSVRLATETDRADDRIRRV